MEESDFCEICKEKPVNAFLWRGGRWVKMCIDCYREDGMRRLKDMMKSGEKL